MASAEEKLARLKEMVETLKHNQQQPVNVTVTAPPTRKLRMFSGQTSELLLDPGNTEHKRPNDCVKASSVNMFKNRIDR